MSPDGLDLSARVMKEYNMLNQKIALHTPGPTPIPPQVAAAMTMPMINHRSDVFSKLALDVAEKLQPIFQTKEQVYVLSGSGSAGWEATMVNFVPAGAKVLNIVIGDFGERWAKANTALGFQVERLDYQIGTAARPDDVAAYLAQHEGAIKAVCLQHNETSTGVFNPVREIAAEAAKYGALVLLDAVSSAGALPLKMDEWGVDVVLTGSQKALMCPPGLMIITASQKAWAMAEQAKTPKFFFDLRHYRKTFEQGQTPYTPPLSLYYGLQAALQMLEEEGHERTLERHHLIGEMCRAGIKAAGLQLFCQDERFASDTITAVRLPADVEASTFRKAASKTFGVVLAGGQGNVMKDLIFRIGHMGYMTPNDVILALAAVENSFAYIGYPLQPGKAVAAAQAVWLEHVRSK
jgi:aspartate aminotransferase-like enzyme